MNTPEMEKLIYWYFKESSLVIVPKVSGNNWWLDTEADPMIWKNIVNHECDMLIVTKNGNDFFHFTREVDKFGIQVENFETLRVFIQNLALGEER